MCVLNSFFKLHQKTFFFSQCWAWTPSSTQGNLPCPPSTLEWDLLFLALKIHTWGHVIERPSSGKGTVCKEKAIGYAIQKRREGMCLRFLTSYRGKMILYEIRQNIIKIQSTRYTWQLYSLKRKEKLLAQNVTEACRVENLKWILKITGK